jgi:oligopeptide transport system ATP-binding protein
LDRPLLDVDALTVRFRSRQGLVHAVSEVTFTLGRGETLAIVGESGSGKSTAGLAIMGPPVDQTRLSRALSGRSNPAAQGSASSDGPASGAGARQRRRHDLPDPMSRQMDLFSRLPDRRASVATSGRQLGAEAEALGLLDELGIPTRSHSPSYPHQLSGGMRQRVMIAIALSCRPGVLIADEPTTALDVTIQAQILALLKRLQRETAMAMIFITHNLGVVAEIADRMMVMYAGRIVETGSVRDVFKAPRMPYTRSLLASLPRLDNLDQAGARLEAIPGNVPSALALPMGCSFHPRCRHHRTGICDGAIPPLEACEPDRFVRCARWREIG